MKAKCPGSGQQVSYGTIISGKIEYWSDPMEGIKCPICKRVLKAALVHHEVISPTLTRLYTIVRFHRKEA